MTIIHAITRQKKYTINIVATGAELVFNPNSQGHVVCKVVCEASQEWLLANTMAFRVYGEQAEQPISALLTAGKTKEPSELGEPSKAAGENGKETPPADPYVLANGDTTFDLKPLTDEELHAFAKTNGIAVHHMSKGNTIRDKIVGALKILA